MDFSFHLFRCSSLGHLISDPKAKVDKDAGNLSESAKTHLTDVYVANKYGRHTDIETNAISKGTFVEEDSITLYSRFRREIYRKNTEHLQNRFIKGTPDIRIKSRKEVYDVKSSWDIFTFAKNLTEKIKPLYYWQVHGYMWLDEAVSGRIVYCLVNTPEFLIEAEATRLKYKIPPDQLEHAIAECRHNLTFNDIPYRERIIEQPVKRSESDIQKIEKKVIQGRLFLNKMEAESKLRSLNSEFK